MTNAVELVFVPCPAMGHIPSTVKLAKLILQRNENISISFYILTLPNHPATVKSYIDSQSRDNPYPTRLTFITFPPINPPDQSSPDVFGTAVELQKPLVKQVIEERVRAGSPKPAGIVLDLFGTGMMDIAKELNIPSYISFASGANILNHVFYAQSLADDHGVDVVKEFSDPSFSRHVSGFKNPVTSSAIPSMLQEKGIRSEMLINMARKFRETKGILLNTYIELESFGIQALLSSDDNRIPPVYPVGPVLELDNKSRGGSDNEESSVMQWLNDQPKCSVVFLSFGSKGTFNEEQVNEIANGLERSGYRFLWALRRLGTPDDNEPFLEALPEGFINRTSNKCKIIGWAPQVAILAHPAIGGFVSHCGWNSTLESLWFGVPIATWPIYAEQQLNAFELVKELGLAVEVRMDYKSDFMITKGNFLVTAREIENAVRKLMNMDEKMKGKIEKMSNEGKMALEKGGSSYNWLGRFIENVLSNIA